MKTPTAEFNLDSLVGPTHNYAGLAHGNLASQQNRNLTSHPRQAALQGLDKMKLLHDLGLPQVVLPPQSRPHLPTLRNLGFTGTDEALLQKAAQTAPHLLAAVSSSSSMWAANSATLAPSPDTHDGLLHLTPANLASHFHRSLETPATAATLRHILPGPLFSHHHPLPSTPAFFDEGAANHSRLCPSHGDPALHLFTFGHDPNTPRPTNTFTSRHSLSASQAIARLHQLDPARTFFAQQHPAAIDAGVFHNDVISVAHRNILLHHELAWADSDQLINDLRTTFSTLYPKTPLLPICIPNSLLPLQDAVRSYLFNSQLLSLPDNTPMLLAPTDCQAVPTAMAALDFIRQQLPTLVIRFADIRQSMQNGGGPACLRLRIVLTPHQQSALHPAARFTDSLYSQLRAVIEKTYREDLHPADLADPLLLTESRTALHAIHTLLQLPTQ